jgi:tetratricopeptide (TPR) repeat protein
MRRARRRLVCAGATLVAGAMIASPARAEGSSSEGEGYIERGIELRRLGKNADALGLFERAYSLDPTARAEAQVALARQAIGDWVGAESGLREALAFPDDPWIARYRSVLERALATVQAHLGWLDVEVNVAQGDLVLDGTAHYDLPLTSHLRVVARTVQIEVRAPDRSPVRQAIEVIPGAEVRVVVALESRPAPPPPAASAAMPAQGVAASWDTSRARMPPPVAGYLSLGVAAALSGVAVVAWRVREDNAAVYDDDSRCLVGTATREQQCGARAQAANVALGVEAGSFALAGLSVAIGVWLLWPSRARSPAAAHTSCGSWAGLGVACEGRF